MRYPSILDRTDLPAVFRSVRCPRPNYALTGKPEPTMTAKQFKSQLRQRGKTIRQWAEENNFPPESVYRALNGVLKGHYGLAHEILARAGVKPAERKSA